MTTNFRGFAIEDLYRRSGLISLDQNFIDYLKTQDIEAYNQLVSARAAVTSSLPASLTAKNESDLLIKLAPYVEAFIGELFGIQKELSAFSARINHLRPIYTCKEKFVRKRALKTPAPEVLALLNGAKLQLELEKLMGELLSELSFSRHVVQWMNEAPFHEAALDIAAQYSIWAVHSMAGREKHANDVLFKLPHKIDPLHLVPVETVVKEGVTMMRLPESMQRNRQGFALTDSGTDLKGALNEIHYCIWCHHQDKDSCSKGLKDRKTGTFQQSPFGVTLAGCPLEEKISEMHEVKAQGHSIAALGIVAIDNPMCAGTGHRICNDCMKSCIYQKQEPVNIPQAETRVLKDVLELPWGFEIYSLLTRWNPLDIRRPLPRPDTNYKILVAGLGPAGFTLAHHLMNDGHTVVGIDGLKIEPLPSDLSGVNAYGERVSFKAIRDIRELYERLDERVMAGFGGVAEYGITVRWDKNFLKIIRLLLERRSQFAMIGGVRFGGTLTIEDAFAAGFDHIALCAGAGKPTVISMKNGLARGVRQASDFLMALQLTGAARKDSIANLEVRLPIVVVGGGLTAIDTATESLAYYPIQVEKFLQRYETLCNERGQSVVQAQWNEEERQTAEEFIRHAKEIRAERFSAEAENREPKIRALLESWGGVSLVYRRRLIDSPSYTLNHEEVHKAMEEGVGFIEGATPKAVEIDNYGHASGLRVVIDNQEKILLAKTILIAAGTQPNTVLAREAQKDSIRLDGKYFRALNEQGQAVTPSRLVKSGQVDVLMDIQEDGRAISFFGDLHPSYAGNVVKAMASAKQGYPVISRVLACRPSTALPATDLVAQMNQALRARVQQINRLTSNIVEIVVHAPQAARRFEPGQFYRLQNFETLSQKVNGTTLAMEGLALTGAWVDKEKGLLSTIVLEMGGSSDLCALLKPNEPVILMGPTGTPTEIPDNETLCLVGGGLGNAVLFSIGQAARARGCKVIYFAGYRKPEDRYKTDQIEKAADLIIWCCDRAPGLAPTRALDKSFIGNIVQGMLAYASGQLGTIDIPLLSVDRIIAIGSDRMMAAVGQARHAVLAPYLKPDHIGIGSINSPMQCMMKEICAQCLQLHRDPITGEETVIFSCFNQDQLLDHVDFNVLHERLGQNAVQEKLTGQWIKRCLHKISEKEKVAFRENSRR